MLNLAKSVSHTMVMVYNRVKSEGSSTVRGLPYPPFVYKFMLLGGSACKSSDFTTASMDYGIGQTVFYLKFYLRQLRINFYD